jgi:MoaA/NifB/PqqE/SkfB family radical SAM enzyme
MPKPYRVALNMEWTSKCNARCSMCPRDAMNENELMKPETFQTVLHHIHADQVSRVVIAGYGEPTTHPHFDEFLTSLEAQPVRFDMVTNGQLLSHERLQKMDGKLGLLMISFSSIVKAIYENVHRNLDYDRVVENILLAHRTLKKTQLGISLSPVPEALPTLGQTVTWFRKQGINGLTMSPTLYNRAGSDPDLDLPPNTLRNLIKTHGLHSQELDFVSGIGDFVGQWRSNKFKCAARNSDLFITAGGSYLQCFNDIGHNYTLGHVSEMSIQEALAKRHLVLQQQGLCDQCNMLGRYKPMEVARVAWRYSSNQITQALGNL